MCIFLIFRKKRNKGGAGGSLFSYLSGKEVKQKNQLNDLVMVIALEQIINNSKDNNYAEGPTLPKGNEKKEYIEKTKQEIMELFRRD